MILPDVLGLTLLVALPADALWRTWRPRPQRSRERRYISTITQVLILLLALVLVAQDAGMSGVELGLAWPPSLAGLIGFAVGAVGIGGLLIASWFAKAKPGQRNAGQEKALANLPETGREMVLFVILAPVVGFGWEILYRGFLLWWMIPTIGTVAAVLATSLAYGLAHGWQSRMQIIGSIVSALLFSTAYVVTGSLWWLVFIHTALPLIAIAAARRARSIDTQCEALAA